MAIDPLTGMAVMAGANMIFGGMFGNRGPSAAEIAQMEAKMQAEAFERALIDWNTPHGTIQYNQNPETGRWTGTTTLSPDQQVLYDQKTGMQHQLGTFAREMLLPQYYADKMNPGHLPAPNLGSKRRKEASEYVPPGGHGWGFPNGFGLPGGETDIRAYLDKVDQRLADARKEEKAKQEAEKARREAIEAEEKARRAAVNVGRYDPNRYNPFGAR